MTMLIRWEVFTEDITRFYIAECVLAIEAIHKLDLFIVISNRIIF